MSDLEGIGKEKLPSVLKDPFNKISIDRIMVVYDKNLFSDEWSARGTVSFKNGDTNGEQKFKGDTFDEVVIKIKHFFNEIK